jgi:hypothetical protein
LESPIPRNHDRTPPPIRADRPPRLATFIFRHYLYPCPVGSRERTIALATGFCAVAGESCRRSHH